MHASPADLTPYFLLTSRNGGGNPHETTSPRTAAAAAARSPPQLLCLLQQVHVPRYTRRILQIPWVVLYLPNRLKAEVPVVLARNEASRQHHQTKYASLNNPRGLKALLFKNMKHKPYSDMPPDRTVNVRINPNKMASGLCPEKMRPAVTNAIMPPPPPPPPSWSRRLHGALQVHK